MRDAGERRCGFCFLERPPSLKAHYSKSLLKEIKGLKPEIAEYPLFQGSPT